MSELKPDTLLVKTGRPHGPGQPLNAPIVPASNVVLGQGTVYSRISRTHAAIRRAVEVSES